MAAQHPTTPPPDLADACVRRLYTGQTPSPEEVAALDRVLRQDDPRMARTRQLAASAQAYRGLYFEQQERLAALVEAASVVTAAYYEGRTPRFADVARVEAALRRASEVLP